MTDHPTSHDTEPSDGATRDEFDQLARSAGAELRRPAPADGMQRVRSARRRQQVTRGVAAGGAAVLLVGMGAFVALRGTDDGGDVATVPDPTVPDATVPDVPDPSAAPTTITEPAPTTVPGTTEPPPTTVAPTTTAPPAAPSAFDAWAEEQRAAGRTTVQRYGGEGTTAVGLVAWNQSFDDFAGAVLLADGRLVEIDGVDEQLIPNGQLYGLADRVALLDVVDDEVGLRVLDEATGEWLPRFDTGLRLARESGEFTSISSIDGSLLIGVGVWVDLEDGTTVPGDERRGVVVRPDLAVTVAAAPPEGVQFEWSSTTDGKALNFGLEPGASNYLPFTQPWAYDLDANEWSPIPLPEWLACAGATSCEWRLPHEFGDPFLEEVTSDGVVKRLPDGTVGLYDAVEESWVRFDDGPFELALPATALLDDRLVVAPVRRPGTSDEASFGQVAVLDLGNGTWAVTRFDVGPDAMSWELRQDAVGVILATVDQPPEGLPTTTVVAALDSRGGGVGGGDWRSPTSDVQQRWDALEPMTRVG